MPHICHIATTCNLRSGSAKRTLTILKACIARGYQTTYICGRSHDITSSDLPGGRVLVLPDLVKYIHILSDLKALKSLVKILRTIRPDLVHTHLAKAGIVGRLAAKLTRVPVIVHTVHGPTFAPGVRPVNRALYWLLEKMAARWTDFFVFVGQELRRSYIRARICRKAASTVIYTGRPPADFQQNELSASQKRELRHNLCNKHDPEFLMLSVGRIVPSKQQHHCIDVLSHICQNGVDARLAIVGQAFLTEEKSHRDELVCSASLKGVGDRVHLTGFREDILDVIQAADVVLITSKYEGLPNIAIESRIARTPIIGYALPGVKEVIEGGKNGWLVPKGDIRGLGDAVLNLFFSRGYLGDKSTTSLGELEKKFSITHMVENELDLYYRLMDRRFRGRPHNSGLLRMRA